MSIRLDELNESVLRHHFRHAGDILIDTWESGDRRRRQSVVLLYCEGMTDSAQINRIVLPQLQEMVLSPSGRGENGESETTENGSGALLLKRLNDDDWFDIMKMRLYSGHLVLFFNETRRLYTIDISRQPNRNPEESSTEVSIKGPRDAFTESMVTNVALVRKRLKTDSLCCERFVVGRRTRTSVSLLYLDDVIRPEVVDTGRQRLLELDTDGLISSNQLEEDLADNKFSLFPLLEYIGRPDYVVDSLLRGRMAFIVDGSPMAVVAPSNLTYLLNSPEDVHTPYYYVALERLLRSVGIMMALFLPGLWIAVTAFNFDQIPFPLLATITSLRIGLPLSGPMDFFLMLGLFELFREAGMRLPKPVGQTVAVVGGLIVGDSAIRAGVTGPATLVVTAISTISMFTLVNQSLAGTITLLRIVILIISSFLGMFGFILSVVALVFYLATLESFGVPYLAPLSPPRFREWVSAIMAMPLWLVKRRPGFLNTIDDTRKEGDSP